MRKRSKSADATYNAYATRFDELGKQFPECRVLLFVGNENSIPERLNRSPGIVFQWPMLERKTCSDEVIRLPEEFWVPASSEIVAKSKSQKVTQQFLAVVSGPDVSLWKKGEPWWDIGTDDLGKLTQAAKTCVKFLSPQTAESIESGENDRRLVSGVFCSLLFDAFWMTAKHHNVVFDTDGGFEYEHYKGVKPNELIRPTDGLDSSERPKPWVISLPGCRCVDFGESIFNVAARFFRLSPQLIESHVNSTFRLSLVEQTSNLAVQGSRRERDHKDDIERAANELFRVLWRSGNRAEWGRRIAKKMQRETPIDSRTVVKLQAWVKAKEKRDRRDRIGTALRRAGMPAHLIAEIKASPDNINEVIEKMDEKEKAQLKRDPELQRLLLQQSKDDSDYVVG